MRDRRIEEALAAWREAERQLENASNGDRDALEAEVERHKFEFQRLSGDYMLERLGALHEAEERRRTEEPSTRPFHQAAQDEMEIARDIWSSARQSDEDTPESRSN